MWRESWVSWDRKNFLPWVRSHTVLSGHCAEETGAAPGPAGLGCAHSYLLFGSRRQVSTWRMHLGNGHWVPSFVRSSSQCDHNE
ncbi:mCG123744 [Mus musculus]|nr:mCG123744 [Mus musculus]